MSYQFELRHWRYFTAVAEELHFRKAAERLYISQPGLSRQIKDLEETIGVQLFERKNKKVTLTAAGSFLYPEIQRLMQGFKHAIDQSKLIHQGLQGSLRISYVGSAMQQIIPQMLSKFEKEYPGIVFNLKEMDIEKQLAAIGGNTVDVGFVRLDQIPSDFNFYPILKEPFCLVLPKHHNINSSNFSNLNQLREESFILFDPNYSRAYYQKVMQIFDESGFTPNVTHNTIHAGSIFQLVAHGLGISIIPKSLANDSHNSLKFIDLNTIPQRTTLSAIWQKESTNQTLAHFIQALENIIL